MRIVFAGTPEFASVILKGLIEHDHTIVGVYTQPDRKKGRGLHLAMSPVKALALQHELPIYQPLHFKSEQAVNTLIDLAPQLMIVAAYGLILPASVLNIPSFGCLNVHASLLPRWRGASPILHALLAGDSTTGVSLMQMEAGLDTGPVLATKAQAIKKTDTTGSLTESLSALGRDLLLQALQADPLTWHFEPQNNELATHAPKIHKSLSRLDFNQPADYLARAVRAYHPWPGAYALFEGEPLRIHQAQVVEGGGEPGMIVEAGAAGISIATPKHCLMVTHMQLPGKKAMPVKEILNAKADWLAVGARFSS